MYLPYYGFYRYDSTYLLVFLGFIITMLAQFKLKSTYSKYSRIRSYSNLSGKDVARIILNENGLYDVKINFVAGYLSDHYNPRNKSVNLSSEIYNGTSIAAISVAAHECGHAIQDNQEYSFLKFRTLLFPVASIGSTIAIPLIFLGIFLGALGGIFIQIGIILFSFAVLFQIVTLPVEFDASKRAIVCLDNYNILPKQEEKGAKKVLFAAALTYVASVSASILQLLRLLILFGGRRDD